MQGWKDIENLLIVTNFPQYIKIHQKMKSQKLQPLSLSISISLYTSNGKYTYGVLQQFFKYKNSSVPEKYLRVTFLTLDNVYKIIGDNIIFYTINFNMRMWITVM